MTIQVSAKAKGESNLLAALRSLDHEAGARGTVPSAEDSEAKTEAPLALKHAGGHPRPFLRPGNFQTSLWLGCNC